MAYTKIFITLALICSLSFVSQARQINPLEEVYDQIKQQSLEAGKDMLELLEDESLFKDFNITALIEELTRSDDSSDSSCSCAEKLEELRANGSIKASGFIGEFNETVNITLSEMNKTLKFEEENFQQDFNITELFDESDLSDDSSSDSSCSCEEKLEALRANGTVTTPKFNGEFNETFNDTLSEKNNTLKFRDERNRKGFNTTGLVDESDLSDDSSSDSSCSCEEKLEKLRANGTIKAAEFVGKFNEAINNTFPERNNTLRQKLIKF